MSDMPTISSDAIAQQRDDFIDRFLGFASGTFNMFSIYIGDRLGLYRALSQNSGSTPKELAAKTGTHARYIREWLEQQTVAGIVEVEDENKSDESRRYRLPPGHAEALIDCDSGASAAPGAGGVPDWRWGAIRGLWKGFTRRPGRYQLPGLLASARQRVAASHP